MLTVRAGFKSFRREMPHTLEGFDCGAPGEMALFATDRERPLEAAVDYGQSATPVENQPLVPRFTCDPHCRYDARGAS